jgi:iron(III) transport system substrate-binding protein
MKKLAIAALCAVSMSVPILSGGPTLAEDGIDSIYQAAKKEGKVVYWSSLFVSTVGKLRDAFSKRFPGIAVEPFRLSNTQIIQRVTTEAEAGRHTVDLVDLPVLYLPRLQAKALIEPYPWAKTFGVPSTLIFGGGTALATFHIDMPIAINTNLVKPGEIKSWKDLTDPKWRGKLLVEARAQPFYILSLAWGEKRADEFARAIVANRPTVISGGAAAVEALAGGQAAVAIGALGNRILQYREKGAPVDWARVGPIPAVIYLEVPLKDAPHRNAARLWTWFMTTPEAQKVLWGQERFGLLAGTAISPHGEAIKAAGLHVVFESTDPKLATARIKKYVGMLSGLRK